MSPNQEIISLLCWRIVLSLPSSWSEAALFFISSFSASLVGYTVRRTNPEALSIFCVTKHLSFLNFSFSSSFNFLLNSSACSTETNRPLNLGRVSATFFRLWYLTLFIPSPLHFLEQISFNFHSPLFLCEHANTFRTGVAISSISHSSVMARFWSLNCKNW